MTRMRCNAVRRNGSNKLDREEGSPPKLSAWNDGKPNRKRHFQAFLRKSKNNNDWGTLSKSTGTTLKDCLRRPQRPLTETDGVRFEKPSNPSLGSSAPHPQSEPSSSFFPMITAKPADLKSCSSWTQRFIRTLNAILNPHENRKTRPQGPFKRLKKPNVNSRKHEKTRRNKRPAVNSTASSEANACGSNNTAGAWLRAAISSWVVKTPKATMPW